VERTGHGLAAVLAQSAFCLLHKIPAYFREIIINYYQFAVILNIGTQRYNNTQFEKLTSNMRSGLDASAELN
jgi:hypothetical protein